jgi:hypothetical protein
MFSNLHNTSAKLAQKIRSVRIVNSIACSGLLVWLFPTAWDAVKLACQEKVFTCLLDRFGRKQTLSDNSCAPRRNLQNFLPIFDTQHPAFYPIGIKMLVVCMCY